MFMRSALSLPLIALFACAAPVPEAAPAPTPPVVVPEVEVVADKDAESEPGPSAITEERRAIALELVEEGRSIQQQRGEGGAADAVDVYQRALEQDPGCTQAWWELGWSYQVLSDFEKAVQSWDRLREIDINYPELGTYYPVLVMRRDQAAALAALPELGALPAPEEEPRPGPNIILRAVGDVHMGRGWPENRARLPPNGGRDFFAGVRELLQNADVTFGNLETALKDDGPSSKCGPHSTKCFAFRVPTAFADVLKEAGFDVMSIANNHAGDFGPEGRMTTIESLDRVGIGHSGPVGDIASWETKGLKMAMIAFSTGGGVYRIQDIEMAKKVVADVDRTHDLVIVSFHGGAEGAAAAHVTKNDEKFYGEDRGNVWEFAHAVIDAGADLVLGHGPHRLRAMEIYKGRLIAFSLGNFSTWETFSLSGALGVSAVLEVSLAANGVVLGAKIHPVVLEEPGPPRPDAQGQAIKIIRDLSRQDFGQPVFDKHGIYQRSDAHSVAETAQSS